MRSLDLESIGHHLMLMNEACWLWWC